MVEQGRYLINVTGATANELILKPVYFDTDVDMIFRRMLMNKNKQKIAFADSLENVLQSRIGCGFTPKGDFNLYERCINLEDLKVNLEFCVDELQSLVYEEALRAGTSVTDITGTLYEAVIRTRVQQAIKKDCNRLAFWGNTASADNNYNLVDGLWTYIFDLVNKSLVPYTNTGSGAPLAAGDAIDIFQGVWENAPVFLKDLPTSEKIILVSNNIYEAWLKDLEDGVTNDSFFFNMQTQDVQAKSYRGIQIVPMYDWARYAAAAYPATLATDANLIVYTSKNNLILGSDVSGVGADYKTWFDEDSDLFKVKANFKIGFNYALEDFMSVGY